MNNWTSLKNIVNYMHNLKLIIFIIFKHTVGAHYIHSYCWQSSPLSISNTFSSSQTETPSPWQPLVFYGISMTLTALVSPYQWNHTMFFLSWLANFTQCNVFNVYPCCSRYQNSLPPWRYHCMGTTVCKDHVLFIHSSIHDVFHHWAIVSNATMNIDVQTPVFSSRFQFFGAYTQKWNGWNRYKWIYWECLGELKILDALWELDNGSMSSRSLSMMPNAHALQI